MAKDILNFNNYRVIKRIGTGARSAIYLANDEIENTQIALKRVGSNIRQLCEQSSNRLSVLLNFYIHGWSY